MINHLNSPVKIVSQASKKKKVKSMPLSRKKFKLEGDFGDNLEAQVPTASVGDTVYLI